MHIMRQSLVTVDFVENKSNNIITQALTWILAATCNSNQLHYDGWTAQTALQRLVHIFSVFTCDINI